MGDIAIVTFGIAAVGKTILSLKLSKSLNFPIVHYERVADQVNVSTLANKDFSRKIVYERMHTIVGEELKEHRNIIVDSGLLNEFSRTHVLNPIWNLMRVCIVVEFPASTFDEACTRMRRKERLYSQTNDPIFSTCSMSNHELSSKIFRDLSDEETENIISHGGLIKLNPNLSESKILCNEKLVSSESYVIGKILEAYGSIVSEE